VYPEKQWQAKYLELTEMPSPPPHVILYEDPATTTAGTEVKAISGVCASAATAQAAPARTILKRRIVGEKTRERLANGQCRLKHV